MTRETGDRGSPYLVPAVDRALCLLALLRVSSREMGLVELAKATGWNKSSVQKLLVTLLHHGIVERDERTKRYSLGLALAEYGRAALDKFDLRRVAKPLLQALVDVSGETAVLGVRQGDKVVMIDKKEPLVQIRVSPFIGTRYPITETAHGKALLAWLPDTERDQLVRAAGLAARTSKSITETVAYAQDLERTRKRGYAEDSDEFQAGVSGVAAPVFTPTGQVVATLSLAAPTFRVSPERLADFGRQCGEQARELGRRLGP